MRANFLVVFLVVLLSGMAAAFEEEELEVYDVVEDVNSNFYEFLELKPDCSASDIRKAYRRLSLTLHPDKSDAPDAETKFRHLVAVYETLKDKNKREIYDRVLVEGLPDWRMPVFYYRRMRKIGLVESLAYLFVIVTVFQYFINWAAYWEKNYSMSEQLATQMKKIQKNAAKNKIDKGGAAEIERAMEEEKLKIVGAKPTCFDTLPFQLYRLSKWAVLGLPSLPSTLYSAYQKERERKAAAERAEREAEEEAARREEEKREKKEQRKQRKRVDRYVDRTGEAGNSDSDSGPPPLNGTAAGGSAFAQPANALQVWTDADLAKLARLMKKYPAGTPERWERIAEVMERLPWEITKMAKRVKDVAYQVPISKGAQGVTGLESKKLVSDDRMEAAAASAESEEDDEEDEDGLSDVDEDEESDGEYGGYTVASKDDYVPPEVKEKKKTKGGKLGNVASTEDTAASEASAASSPAADEWSQEQQVALESALAQFPKGSAERWERIAGKVPGKSKEQCMLRFRHLAEVVRKRKEGNNNAATS